VSSWRKVLPELGQCGCLSLCPVELRITFEVVDATSWSKDLAVEIASQDAINHLGASTLRIIADRTGLTSNLSRTLTRRGFTTVHDRDQVLSDAAVLIADGGRVLSGLAKLRDQAALFGPVASDPTLWRALSEIAEIQRSRVDRRRVCTIMPNQLRRWPTEPMGSLRRLLKSAASGQQS